MIGSFVTGRQECAEDLPPPPPAHCRLPPLSPPAAWPDGIPKFSAPSPESASLRELRLVTKATWDRLMKGYNDKSGASYGRRCGLIVVVTWPKRVQIEKSVAMP